MGSPVRLLTVCLISCLGFPASALGAEALSGGSRSGEGPLVVPGVQSLVGPGQVQAQEEARLSSPGAVVALEESQTKFEGLGAAEAAKLAEEAFPGVLMERAGGLGELPSGAQVVGYPSDSVAQLDLGGGVRGLVASTVPIATVDSSGERVPLNLALGAAGNAFQPLAAAVGVRIPRRLEEGVALGETGVSLAPVDASGLTLSGTEGAVAGASAFFGGTGVDADTAVKPLPAGFEADTILRAVDSPEHLYFRLSLPEGASLRETQGNPAGLTVVDEGAVIAAVLPPTATDAAGRQVPVSMSVSGDVIELSVAHPEGAYQYPVEVDPTVIDTALALYDNWQFGSKEGSGFWVQKEYSPERLIDNVNPTENEWGALIYPSQGESRIYEFTTETAGSDPSDVENLLEIVGKGGVEGGVVKLGAKYGPLKEKRCAGTCGNSEAGSYENGAWFEQNVTLKGSEEGHSTLYGASVSLAQSHGPKIALSSEPKDGFAGWPNYFYGHGWVGPLNESEKSSTELMLVEGSDPGLGVSAIKATSSKSPEWHETRYGYCYGGVPCSPTFKEDFTYWSAERHHLNDGVQTVAFEVSDPVGLTEKITTTVRVDGTAPHSLGVSGLPKNHEIGSGQYHLTATATDGTESTESSGVGQIKLKMDGKELGSGSGSCSPGPCTASREVSISGTEYAVGAHTLVETAIDSVGNEAKEETTIYVGRPTTPMSVGPVSVNPQSGELNLSATDVSVGGPGSALTLSRSYGSLHLEAGAEGPLGAGWAMELGQAQNVTKLPSGNALLTTGTGLQAIFVNKGAGEFTAPRGDESLTLKETSKESKVEFTLTSASKVATHFTLPAGTGSVWMPSSREGPAGAASKVAYTLVGSSMEPSEELAATPTGVKCSEGFPNGCRKLTFVYAKSTSASGDGATEWGEYANQLKEVTFTAWNPASGKAETIAVAAYQYDKEGRLRAEWDPRIKPELKTTYGYDAEGHLISVAAPGQQPFLFTYGAVPGDTRTGRLLAVTRPGETTPAGSGQTPKNIEAPTLSPSSPAEGKEVTVSTGAWSNNSLSYSYQWERCSKSGSECVPIPGATNPGFTPLYSEEEHTLAAQVTAINATGTATTTTALSGVIPTNTFAPGYSLTLGGKEGEKGLFSNPSYTAVNEYGEVYVTDSTTNTVTIFNKAGEVLRKFGSTGSEKGQFKEPTGIAVSKAGYVFVSDSGNKRVEEFTSTGGFVASATSPGRPAGLAVEESGGSGWIYVADDTNNRVDKFLLYGTAIASYSNFGTGELKAPAGVADYSKGIYVASSGENVVRVFNPEGKATNKLGGTAGLKGPQGVAVDKSGDVYVVDSANNRLQELNPEGKILWVFGTAGSNPGQLSNPTGLSVDTTGNLYIVDTGNKRVEKFVQDVRPPDPPVAPAVPPKNGSSSVWTLEYHVPVSGSGAAYEMSSSEVAKWAQEDDPVEATAVFPPDEAMGWPAQDFRRATVYYLDNPGHTVNIASPGGAITTTEYTPAGDVARTLTAQNRINALKETKTTEAAKLLSTENIYNKEGTQLESTLGPQHTIKLASSGSPVQARKHTQYFYNKGAPETGGPYDLVTEMTVGALISGGKEENKQATTTSYSGQENLGWKLGQATASTADPTGLKLTHTTAYEPETGNVIETRMPANPNEQSPHAKESIYYTAAASSKTPVCGEHPEWAGLTCQTQPAKQPETSGVPNLPVTLTTYNIWDEPEKITETVTGKEGTNTRTKSLAYDAAGRLESTETTATSGTALPAVRFEYSKETGSLVGQSSKVESETRKLSSTYNSLGQLTAYTDADGNTASYKYDTDGRPRTINDGKGSETYTYSEISGLPSELVNEYGTAKLSFTASYNADGKMLSETFPNGMTAKYTYDATDKAVGLEYQKTTHCTEKCTWFKDGIVPTILGQASSQTSSLSEQGYTYDNGGRLTEVQELPVKTGACEIRVYSYDNDGNRTSLDHYEAEEGGGCSRKEGHHKETQTFDQADRLIDTGTSYDPWGNTTKLPAADAGGSELTNTYYDDNQLASQTQGGATDGYQLDPAGRTRETTITGKGAETVTSHYAGAGQEPAWTTNTSAEWTRNIPGINGMLAATQANGETPVLQLTNLHGDIIATASLSETATGLASTADTTEYGVPTVNLPPRYSWLGSLQLPTELPSGIVQMGARSYIPQLGRFLQDDPLPGGSANAYAYTFGDPVNTSDPNGATAIPSWMITFGDAQAQSATEAAIRIKEEEERRAAEELAARIAAENAARYAAELAAMGAGPAFAGAGEEWGEEWWGEEEEYWEEEGEEGYEYISDRQGTKLASGEHQGAPAVLIGPMNSEESRTNSDGNASLCELSSLSGGCSVFARGGEGTHRRGGGRRYSHVGGGNACVGGGTTAAFVSPFLPEVAGVIVGVMLAVGC